MDMDNATLTALARELSRQATKARDELPTGEHEIDATVTLHVSGTVDVGEDVYYRPTASIPLKKALALFVRYSGVTGPAAMDALVRAMRDAVYTPEEALDELADLEHAEKQVLAGLERLPPALRRGAVRVDVAVEAVEQLPSVRKAVAA